MGEECQNRQVGKRVRPPLFLRDGGEMEENQGQSARFGGKKPIRSCEMKEACPMRYEYFWIGGERKEVNALNSKGGKAYETQEYTV